VRCTEPCSEPEREISPREAPDKVQISFKEIETRQVEQIYPADLLEDASIRFASILGYREKQQVDAASVGIIVLVPGEFRADGSAYVQLFPEFSNESLLGSFPVFDFSAGKLPFKRVPVTFTALANEHSTFTMNDAGGDQQRRPYSHRSVKRELTESLAQ